jgi:DNA-binding transcriptional regulator YiaG
MNWMTTTFPIETDEQLYERELPTIYTHRCENILCFLLKQRGITQQQIAKRYNVAQATVRKWVTRNDLFSDENHATDSDE